MRKTLFKGKCKDNGEWVEGDIIHYKINNVRQMNKIIKISVAIALIISLILLLCSCCGLSIIPDCFLLFNIIMITTFEFTYTFFMGVSNYLRKEALRKIIKQCVFCFIQFIIFGELATLFTYIKLKGFAYPFGFLAIYSMIKVFIYIVETNACNLKTDTMICTIHKRCVDELSKDNIPDDVQNTNLDEYEFIKLVNSYDVYVKNYIGFLFKRIEPMMVVYVGGSIISGLAFYQNSTLSGVITLAATVLLAIIDVVWVLIEVSYNESLSELYIDCTNECRNKVKKMIVESN